MTSGSGRTAADTLPGLAILEGTVSILPRKLALILPVSTAAIVLAVTLVPQARALLCSNGSACIGGIDRTTSKATAPRAVIGSPSGLAMPSGLRFHMLKSGGAPNDLSIEVWLQFTAPDAVSAPYLYSANAPGTGVICDDDEPFVADAYPYLASDSDASTGEVVMYPTFGGSGTLEISCETNTTPGGCTSATYCELFPIRATSTDIDADGDTDQADKVALGTAIKNASTDTTSYDLNGDGVVNCDDYDVIALEYNRHVSQVFCSTYSPAIPTDSSPDSDLTRPAAVTNLSKIACDGADITLSWTAPGDDSLTGRAVAYDLRGSFNSITSANFNSADQLLAPDRPQCAGGTESQVVTVGYPTCNYRYFAIKTKGNERVWSAISNVCHVACIDCSGGGGALATSYRDLSLSSAAPNPTRTGITMRYTIPAKNSGSALRISIYDVLGREVRALENYSATPGEYTVRWDLRLDDGSSAQNGVYFLRLSLGNRTLSRAISVSR